MSPSAISAPRTGQRLLFQPLKAIEDSFPDSTPLQRRLEPPPPTYHLPLCYRGLCHQPVVQGPVAIGSSRNPPKVAALRGCLREAAVTLTPFCLAVSHLSLPCSVEVRIQDSSKDPGSPSTPLLSPRWFRAKLDGIPRCCADEGKNMSIYSSSAGHGGHGLSLPQCHQHDHHLLCPAMSHVSVAALIV